MTPRIFAREGFTVVGWTTRLDPQRTDWTALWQEQVAPHEAAIKSVGIGEDWLGVYFGADEVGLVGFVAGMVAPPGTDPPPGLVAREVPAGVYAVVECAIDAIGAAWDAIFAEWLPGSGYEHDPSRPCYEVFHPTESGSPRVEVCFAIKRPGTASCLL